MKKEYFKPAARVYEVHSAAILNDTSKVDFDPNKGGSGKAKGFFDSDWD